MFYKRPGWPARRRQTSIQPFLPGEAPRFFVYYHIQKMEIEHTTSGSTHDNCVAKTEPPTDESHELSTQRRSGGIAQPWRRFGVTYTLMFGLFLLALLVAVGHHRFYLYLNGRE